MKLCMLRLTRTGDKVADRFSNFVERLSNKYVAAMKKHALTRAVAPIILYDTKDGIKRLVPGTTVNAGYMVINMTSATKERIVPPYEKYIAVKDASGKIIYSATVPGNNQLQTLDLTKAGDYTIILSCMDYYGYVVTKKYDITETEYENEESNIVLPDADGRALSICSGAERHD